MTPKSRPRCATDWGYDTAGEHWTREWAGDRVTEYREDRYRVGREWKGKVVWSAWMKLGQSLATQS
jgi:hypothetical protein